jgi:hypothetical protein
MRAVWFIEKFELVLNCNNYENQTSKSRTSQTRKTLAATAFQGFALTIFQVVFNLE